MSGHLKPVGRPCPHRRYRLDCADYDAMQQAADGRCQVCRLAGPDTNHGFLVVDHDYDYGYWAARGLLCSRCNTTLHLRTGDPAVENYLANPWFRQALAERGLSPDLPPEPPIGSDVRLPRNLVMRRGNSGWVRISGRLRPLANSWRGLHYYYGPREIRLTAEGRALTAPARPDPEEQP